MIGPGILLAHYGLVAVWGGVIIGWVGLLVFGVGGPLERHREPYLDVVKTITLFCETIACFFILWGLLLSV